MPTVITGRQKQIVPFSAVEFAYQKRVELICVKMTKTTADSFREIMLKKKNKKVVVSSSGLSIENDMIVDSCYMVKERLNKILSKVVEQLPAPRPSGCDLFLKGL